MNRVLFLPRNGTSWSKMRPQYRLIAERTGWTPLVILADPAMCALRPQLELEGVRLVELPPVARQDRGHFPRLAHLWQRLILGLPSLARLNRLWQHDRVAYALPIALLRLIITRRWLRREYRTFHDCFERLAPFALLVSGDRELGPVLPALKVARDLGIPSVITVSNVPSIPSHSAQRRGQARFFASPSRLAPLLNLYAAHRLPGQVADTPDGRMLFSPGWLTLAFHYENMLSANPWCQGGGQSRFILLDGPRKERIYKSLGVAPQKIRVLGDITQDPVHYGQAGRSALRTRLAERYGFDASEPLTLFAVPIYGEHDLMPWKAHLAELERVMVVLAQSGRNVLLSLHPRARWESYAAMAARYHFPIAKEPMSEIIAAGDLLLCGSSSTIEWAVLCGIPAINLDYAGLDDPAWDQYPGVVRCRGAEELRPILARFDADTEWYGTLSEAQRRTAQDFARFDGRAGERFLAFLDELERLHRQRTVSESGSLDREAAAMRAAAG